MEDTGREPPAAVACFEDAVEACIAHPRTPGTNRRAIPTTDLPGRLLVEERRRPKTIPDAVGERPLLERMFGAMTRAAERWRRVRFTGFERRQIDALRKQPDAEHEAADTIPSASRQARPDTGMPGSSRT